MSKTVKDQTIHDIVTEIINHGIIDGTEDDSITAIEFKIEGEKHMIVYESGKIQQCYDTIAKVVRARGAFQAGLTVFRNAQAL